MCSAFRVSKTVQAAPHLACQPVDNVTTWLLLPFDIISLLGDNLYMEPKERILRIFVERNGKAPFEEWMGTLRDKPTKARIFSRLDRLRLGNFGDCEPVGDGVFELRIHFGPGFRVYFGVHGADVILLLCGGDKSSQKRDIAAARRYWQEFTQNERNKQ